MSELEGKLAAVRNRILLAQIARNLFVALAISGVVFWLFAMLNGYFWFSADTRTALFVIWLGITAAGIVWAVVPPLAKPPSLRKIAIEFENHYPHLQEHLIAAYDLSHENPEEYGYSPQLVRAVVRKAVQMTESVSAGKLIPKGRILNAAGALLLILLLIFGTALAVPDRFSVGTLKIFNPRASFPKFTQTVLTVDLPNSGRAVRFEDYTITIKARGKVPDKVWVYRKLGAQGYAPFEAVRDAASPNMFRYTFRKVVEDIDFFVIGGDYKSSDIHITVLDLPRVIDVSLEYIYPAYTGLAPQKIDRNDGNIDALFGTRVKITARVSKEIDSAAIVLNDTIVIPMKCHGQTAEGTITVRKNGTYTIYVQDRDGNTDPQPPQYSITVQPDEFPLVEITSPGKDIDLGEDMRVPIQVYGEDDFGFSKFILKYVITTQDSTVHSFGLPFKLFGKKQVTIDFVWNLDALGLIPNDVVKYWVEGYDNDAVSGPKMSKSKVYSIRVPSIDEIIQEVTGQQEEQIESVDEALQAQKEYLERTQEMIRQIKERQDEIPYEQREEVQHLIEQQQQLARQLEQTARQMEQTIQKIQENKLVAQQIVEKLWEIQKILDDIMPEELKEAIRKMQEALQQMDPELLKQAMKEFQMSQKELLQKLDRTLELLRRIQAEMKLDELKNLAQRISEMQDKINEALKNGETSEQVQRMENEVKRQMEALQQGMKELAQQMREFEDMPADQMQQLAQEFENMQLPQQAQQALQQMQQGNSKKALSHGQNISEQMKKMAQNLSKLQQQMNQQLQQQLTMDIQRTVRELLYISGGQESLIDRADKLWGKRDSLHALAEKQAELRTTLKQAINRVYDMGGKTMLLPPAVGALLAKADESMAQATDKLAQGYGGMGVIKMQSEALGNINAAAEILLRASESMCKSSSASGMEQLMQQLQSMCNKQGQINQMTIPLMGACQKPGGLNPSQQAMAAKLAAEQAALRKTLEELQKEFEQHANLLGKMDQTIEDMKRVEEDLRSFNITERTLKRQDRILSRMLDAQKSLHKRQYSEKRRSRTGKDVVRKSPGPLPEDLGERKNIIQQSLLQILSNPYPRQYHGEVRKYFRALSREEAYQGEESNGTQ